MTELLWDGKYKDGEKVGPVRIALPFQTVETVNESAQQHQLTLDRLFAGQETDWRNRLIWGDKKYVLPSLLAEFAGQVDLIYIDRNYLGPLRFTQKEKYYVTRYTDRCGCWSGGNGCAQYSDLRGYGYPWPLIE